MTTPTCGKNGPCGELSPLACLGKTLLASLQTRKGLWKQISHTWKITRTVASPSNNSKNKIRKFSYKISYFIRLQSYPIK